MARPVGARCLSHHVEDEAESGCARLGRRERVSALLAIFEGAVALPRDHPRRCARAYVREWPNKKNVPTRVAKIM